MKRSSRRARFLDPAKIEVAINEVGAIVRNAHVGIALAGGCALQLYGSDRFTADVDFVLNGYPPLSQSQLPRKGVLAFGGLKTSAPNGVPVDLIVRDDQYANLYDEALDHAGRLAGVSVPVITLPYLGAMKMVAGRGKDQQDLQFILLDSGVSYKKLRSVVAEHLGVYAADELDALKQTAAWERKARAAKKGARK
jgi:hypothetical protein